MQVICQRCGKVQATVHLTDIHPTEKREYHFCGECAEEEGIVMKSTPMGINEILSKFIMQKSSVQELADLTCEQCGMSFVEFRSHGLLGCPSDYDAFKRALEPLIQRTHEEAVQHVGKVPVRAARGVKTRIDLVRLRRELREAIDKERYEEAARLRDQIDQLESA